jgi:hypothetical protein
VSAYRPPLSVVQIGGRVRLRLGDVCYGHGATLQEAADDLVRRLLGYVMSIRSSGLRVPPELGSTDLAMMNFLFDLGEFASRGGDIRERLFA